MNTLRKYAKNRILEGKLSYELSMHGPDYALKEFCKAFSKDLDFRYPARKIEGIVFDDGEIAVHIISFKNAASTHHNREAIIDFIHDKLGEKLWHGAWITSIGWS